MRKATPQLIGDVLKNVVERLSETKHKDIGKILSAWKSCVGKEFARHTRPASLKKGILQIFVDDSAWFYQANLQKDKLLKELQKKVGEKRIQQIQFRIGRIRPS